jgi:hypothetical protein
MNEYENDDNDDDDVEDDDDDKRHAVRMRNVQFPDWPMLTDIAMAKPVTTTR